MKSRFLIILLIAIHAKAMAQAVNWTRIERTLQEMDASFRKAYTPTPVLLLGTFHFNYPNLDTHKVDSSKMIDVLSTTRQKEIRQIAELVQRFRPTRVYVEVNEKYQPWVDSLYQSYREGKYQLGRNEIFQLGFRIANNMKHDHIYAVDADNFAKDNYEKYTWIDSLWTEAKQVDSIKKNKWNQFYKNHYSQKDDQTLENTLLETLLILADERSLLKSHGHYMVEATWDDKRPDALSMWWYNRNLRIFNNILKTQPRSEDRILVLFGAGHVPILKHLFEASPEFEIIELKKLAKEF